MAKTAAERQQAYRKNRPLSGENGERRINTWVSTAASLALARLARRYAVTQREMLERLILNEDRIIKDALDIDQPEWNEYYGI